MVRKTPFLFFFFALTAVVFAQAESEHEDFWISMSGDGSMYSSSGLAFGGGLSFGYGSGLSIGIKAVWYFGAEDLNTFELNVILRFYLEGQQAYSGPFIQFMGGPTFYGFMESAAIPAEVGMISAGLCFGWRFLFVDSLFIEPSIRVGFPYIVSAAISLGIRF